MDSSTAGPTTDPRLGTLTTVLWHELRGSYSSEPEAAQEVWELSHKVLAALDNS